MITSSSFFSNYYNFESELKFGIADDSINWCIVSLSNLEPFIFNGGSNFDDVMINIDREISKRKTFVDANNYNDNNFGFNLDSTILAEYLFFSNLKNYYLSIKDYPEGKVLIPGYIEDYSFQINSLILGFEYFFGKEKASIMRRKQYILVNNIINKECNIETQFSFYQLLMGSGKSSYVAPLLSLLLSSMGYTPFHVLPKHLLTEAKKKL